MQPLKDDLDSELQVEGLAGTDAGSAVEVADGIVHQAESTVVLVGKRGTSPGDGICGAWTCGHRSGSGSHVDPVEDVKHLRPELDFQALANRNVLYD